MGNSQTKPAQITTTSSSVDENNHVKSRQIFSQSDGDEFCSCFNQLCCDDD